MWQIKPQKGLGPNESLINILSFPHDMPFWEHGKNTRLHLRRRERHRARRPSSRRFWGGGQNGWSWTASHEDKPWWGREWIGVVQKITTGNHCFYMVFIIKYAGFCTVSLKNQYSDVKMVKPWWNRINHLHCFFRFNPHWSFITSIVFFSNLQKPHLAEGPHHWEIWLPEGQPQFSMWSSKFYYGTCSLF